MKRIANIKRRRLHPAVGIRRKIRYGFVILGALLLFSGLISSFEFSRMNRMTGTLLEIDVRDQELARSLLNAIEWQKTARQGDSLFLEDLPVYHDMELEARELITSLQATVDRHMARVRANTYRALMPGIITLGIAILIIFVFYVMIDLYYIRPVLRVRQGLSNYIEGRMPYNVSIEGRDEVRELSDNIATLVTQRKKEHSE